MSDYRALTFDELCEKLEEQKNTLILFHRNPDADAVGSSFALREVLCAMGSPAFCVCENEIPQRLLFLTGNAQSGVTPDSIPADFCAERIISVDTASPNQLGKLYDLYGEKIEFMIDHHGMGTPYADNYIRSDAAASGEILFDIVRRLATEQKITITEELCQNLYAAISSDTGCFRFSNVTPETHQRAAELVASGIDCAGINQKLFDTKSLGELRAQAAGISNLHLFADGQIAVITFPYALKTALGLSDENLEILVDTARSLMGVKVAVAIRQPGSEGVFRVSARSNCEYDVARLCSAFGGGGHNKAAGCTITAADAEEAMNKLVEKIQLSDDN